MDPATALLLTIKSLAEMITELIKGQSPENKKIMWDWYIKDVERLRKMLNITD